MVSQRRMRRNETRGARERAADSGEIATGPVPGGAVAVVGAGVIGRSWIRVFARAGFVTRVWDPDPAQLRRAVAWAARSAAADVRPGFATREESDAERARIVPCGELADALDGAIYLQESGPEALRSKRSIHRELDRAAPPEVILASSTSAHDMTAIARGLPGADRCIVAHPVNPPHVIPLVEVLPGRRTRPEIAAAAVRLLRRCGMAPVVLDRFAPGFVLNRLQAALLREAVSLVGSGVASPEVVDRVMRDGLGLRWALLGPFGTAHLNADGGVGSYLRKYGDAYRSIWRNLEANPDLGNRIIDRIAAAAEASYGQESVAALSAWRDRMVMRIRRLKEDDGWNEQGNG